MKKYCLAITPGDSNGIGSEVTHKALSYFKKNAPSFYHKIEFHIFSPSVHFKNKPANIIFHEPKNTKLYSGWAIQEAAFFVSTQKNSALVTGPISKFQLQKEGYPYLGHTDFLSALFKTKHPTMLLENSFFRVALATDHLPLKKVSKAITPSLIEKKIYDIIHYLGALRIKNPKIALLGLNPHAGENGLLGNEDKDVLLPTLKKINSNLKGASLHGLFSADSFFSTELHAAKKLRHDAILAMYHDQGLTPLKLMGFNQGINVTLGLPIIRTSVDHGTAIGIFGLNQANPKSMINAIQTAIRLIDQKNKES